MRVLLGLLAVVASCLAYDAVIFSDDQELSRDHPSIDALINGASDAHPLVFLVEPDFTLGQFSRQAGAYVSNDKQKSALASTVRSSKHTTQRFMDVSVHVPSAVVVTSADDFKTGSPVYILAAEDWSSLEQLSSVVLPKVPGFTGVLANTEAVSQHANRVKRLSSDLLDSESDAAPQKEAGSRDTASGDKLALPLSLPAFNRTGTKAATTSTCLLYMEGLNIIVSNKKGEVPTAWPSATATILNGTFLASDANVKCLAANTTGGDTVFTVSITPDGAAIGHNVEGIQFEVPSTTPIEFEITFSSDRLGYWALSNFKLNSPLSAKATSGGKGTVLNKDISVKAGSTPKGLHYMGINAVLGYGFNCGDTPAAWFDADSHMIGVSFHNFQVSLGGVNADKGYYFNTQVGDCVGTFSTGSLMGIITSLVLMTVFIFGFLMLNSVQTMDRFDDPKQKQILINVRE